MISETVTHSQNWPFAFEHWNHGILFSQFCNYFIVQIPYLDDDLCNDDKLFVISSTNH